ncbi:MAG TPA: RnfABCDGE type electron transport complex subunit D, partial [Clostridiales bacterium]|nr:RnfABCDGE type electron transport complex subunit D [Clostridiales bacterium]
MPDSSGLNIEEKQSQENSLTLFLMLSGAVLMAWYNYGPKALLLAAVCILTAVVSDFAGLLLVKSRKRKVYDLSAALTGL